MIKKYSVKGVDLRTEVIIGVSIIPFFLIFSVLTIWFYHNMTGVEFRNIPFTITLGGMFSGIVVGLLFARILGKSMSGIWYIEIQQEDLLIGFKNKIWFVPLDELSKLKIFGNPGFKYVSIFYQNESIRMRIGNSGLTPFSTDIDLQQLDNFIKEIQPYLEKHYSKKDGTVKQSPPGTVKLTYFKK
ncbi:hypothetical protein [Chryseobacterium sp.]|uniref:hypothetical protein n=1 Tax=Chryseobacterium sp. TaxID=1871047 RepID=UPI0033422CA0